MIDAPLLLRLVPFANFRRRHDGMYEASSDLLYYSSSRIRIVILSQVSDKCSIVYSVVFFD